MDYIAELISLCANKKNSTPRSFNDLLKWINYNENRTNEVLGEDLKLLIIKMLNKMFQDCKSISVKIC